MTMQGALPARTLYEHGLTRAALGETEAAIEALRLAVAAKPGLGAAWARLAELLDASGDADAAQAARDRQDTGGAEPARVKPGSAGKLEAGERQLRERLAGHSREAVWASLIARLHESPTDAPALRLLAEGAAERGDISRAELLLRRALEVAPSYTGARHRLALLLFHASQDGRAIPLIERLVAEEPRNIGYRVLLASSHANLGNFGQAITLFQAILKDAPRALDVWTNYAQALKHAGRRAEAVAALRRCVDEDPGMGEAWWNLANIKNEAFSPADLALMRAQLGQDTLAPDARIQMHYALGYALEQAGDYEASFGQYSEGARLRRARGRYSAAETSRHVQRSIAVFSPAMLTMGVGCEDPAPIFVLGLPRAGSTLIEQILASHSAVEGTMELPEMHHIARELAGGRDAYPECMAQLSDDARAALGAAYIERTRIYRKTQRPFFIDKMPSNWAYAGLILAILPRAKIIDARRAPMASCWSAFKQFLPGGSGFPSDLADLGRYWRDYAAMMAHLDEAAAGRIHRVQYETMVDHTAQEIRGLLEYCALPFEPACLRFWETRRAVSTASSEQVRQPIYRDGLDSWRHYAPWLGPLEEALGDVTGKEV